MAELQQMPHSAASYIHHQGMSKRRATMKNPVKQGFLSLRGFRSARQSMPPAA
jgi:hypothetical protein